MLWWDVVNWYTDFSCGIDFSIPILVALKYQQLFVTLIYTCNIIFLQLYVCFTCSKRTATRFIFSKTRTFHLINQCIACRSETKRLFKMHINLPQENVFAILELDVTLNFYSSKKWLHSHLFSANSYINHGIFFVK